MKKFESCFIAITIAAFILAGFTTACATPTPSSSPQGETPSSTQIPQQVQPIDEQSAEEPTETAPPTNVPVTKQALFVIYSQFEETEYGKPRTVLEDAGILITVASTSQNIVTGHLGMSVKPDVALSEVNGADYDAVVLIGGYGYVKDDPEASRIVKEAAAAGKVLAAICVAPITLAKAGLLKDKQATSSMDPWFLKSEGAIFVNDNVVRDGLIITANGPAAAQGFGETIVAALQE